MLQSWMMTFQFLAMLVQMKNKSECHLHKNDSPYHVSLLCIQEDKCTIGRVLDLTQILEADQMAVHGDWNQCLSRRQTDVGCEDTMQAMRVLCLLYQKFLRDGLEVY